MDIGCGTGSTFRTLSPLMTDVEWKLLDYETVLLDEAKRQIGSRDDVSFHCADLNTLDETLLDDVAVVTASALFDLCSEDFCRRFVERLARKKIGLYAALNYDGVMEWSIKHPLDSAVAAISTRISARTRASGLLWDRTPRIICRACAKMQDSPSRRHPARGNLDRNPMRFRLSFLRVLPHLSTRSETSTPQNSSNGSTFDCHALA